MVRMSCRLWTMCSTCSGSVLTSSLCSSTDRSIERYSSTASTYWPHTTPHDVNNISYTRIHQTHEHTHTHSYNDTTTQMTVYTCCLMMCRPARPVDANTSRRCASSQSYLVLLMRWVNSSSIVIVLHMTHASHTVTLTLTFIIWPHPSCNLTILWFKRCGVNKQRYYNMTFFMNDDNETRTTDLFCSGK